MRIIAGKLKGRILKSPKGNDVRPTTDKVKEAIFDMLYPYLTDEFVAFDVFAGSGNMGLEAISRGASKVFFSDNSRESLALVRENVKYCEVEDKVIYLNGDFKRNIARVKEKIDIFFLDPPYADGYIMPSLKFIDDADNINEGGIVVCEYSYRDTLPDEIYGFSRVKEKRYGSIGVSIYQRGKKND